MNPLLAFLALVPAVALPQAEIPSVSVDARGQDVCEVIATLFAQIHRPYAIDASVKGKLYVALDRMPFPKALGIVLAQADLVAQDRDGVTMIGPAPKVIAKPAIKTVLPKQVVVPQPVAKPAPIPASVLARPVATRLTRTPLTEVFAALGKQASVSITVDPDVPAYRIDAIFAKTSLRYALDRVCAAAHLHYEPSPIGIRIVRS